MNQENICENTIKEFILDPGNRIEEIIDYLSYCLDYNNEEVIKAIFKALFILLRHYENDSRVRADCLINFLDENIMDNIFREVEMIMNNIDELKRKVKNLKKKQQRAIEAPLDKLNKIYNNINDNLINNFDNKKLKCLEFLIFVEKNVDLVERYLKECKKLFYSDDSNKDDIFSLLIKKYIFLEQSDQREINYYFHIILLFFKSIHSSYILTNKDKYLDIIYKSGKIYKSHVSDLINLFNPKFKISLDEFGKYHNINFEFPNGILSEMYTFKSLNNERNNFTYQECITIDDKNALCLDDALYIEKNKDGTYNLYIHITDIPSFVPYDSLTNEEAEKRGESLYLSDMVIQMYPEFISNTACSLLPNNNRNVISYIFKLDPDFNLIEDEFDIVKAKIRVAHKMSYDEVDAILSNPSYSNLDQMLMNLCLFAIKRRNSNKFKELYRNYENFFRLRNHHESLQIDVSNAANIVHETMILTNYSIAKYFKELSLPYLFRMLSLPSENFIEDISNRIKDEEQGELLTNHFWENLKESYIKATYTSVPKFHCGLDLECYSHSTSPARRYADAIGQYIIHDLIFGGNLLDSNIYKWDYRVNKIVNYLNKRKHELEIFQEQYNYLCRKRRIRRK